MIMEVGSYNQALDALRSSKEEERAQAASKIRELVWRAGRELGVEMQRFEEILYNNLFTLVHSKVLDEKLGGVVAIEALIGAPSAESEMKGIKFANGLSNALKQQCNVRLQGGASAEFVTRAAAALGRLAKRGPASSSEHVEFEVTRALEWLQYSGSRRLTACLVLSELAKHALTLFCAQVREFFARIWPALIDAQSTKIRDAAASALGAALEIFSLRPTTTNIPFYCSIYNHAYVALEPYIAAHATTRPELAIFSQSPLLSDPNSTRKGRFDRVSADRGGLRTADDRERWCQPFGACGVDKARGLSSPPVVEGCGGRNLPCFGGLFPRKGDGASSEVETSDFLVDRHSAPSFGHQHQQLDLEAALGVASDKCHASLSPASGFRMSASPEATVHGSLLVVGALLDHEKDFMLPRFREACNAAITLTEHPSETIQKAVTELLPRLAQYSPVSFSRLYLRRTTEHLLQMAKRASNGGSDLRNSSYEAIGQLALAVKGHLVPYIPDIVEVICEHGLNVSYAPAPSPASQQHSNLLAVNFDVTNAPELHGAGKRGLGGALSPSRTRTQHHLGHQRTSSQLGPTTFQEQRRRDIVIDCVANLVETLRNDMETQHIDTLLDALFAGGLSKSLIHALHVISEVLPSRRPIVRARLLDALTSVLTTAHGITYAPPGWSRPGSRKRYVSVPADQEGHADVGGNSRFGKLTDGRINGVSDPTRSGQYHRRVSRGMSQLDRSHEISVPAEREEIVLLTLRALSEFSMRGVCMLPLVRDRVSLYLNCPTSAPIRAAAVATCARLLLPPPKHVEEATPLRGLKRLSTSATFEQRPMAQGTGIVADPGGLTGLLPTGVFSESHLRLSHTTAPRKNLSEKRVLLTNVAEDTKYEHPEDEEIYTGEDEPDTSSIADSTDPRRGLGGPTPREYIEDENRFDQAGCLGTSQASNLSTEMAKHNTKQNSELKQRSDGSSTRSGDSDNTLASHRRYSSHNLADDASIKRGRVGTRGLGRRPHRSLSNVAGLLVNDSLRSQKDDTLPPWYYVGPSAVVVDDMLRKLLEVALADEDPTPRAAVLKALRGDDRFDAHLCQAHHVEVLSLLLHDEDIEMQLAALPLLGRLAAHNPAAVLSRLRDALSRSLQSLRCDVFDAKAKDRAARLAAAALRAESPVVRRCVWPLAADVVASLPLGSRELGKWDTSNISHSDVGGGTVFGAGVGQIGWHKPSLHRLSHSASKDARKIKYEAGLLVRSSLDEAQIFATPRANPINGMRNRLACSALDALAECVLVLGPQARSCVYTPRVLAPLFDALLDRSSSHKRELALKVMGRLASSAGCVVAPYIEHPPLLPQMLAVLRENHGGNLSTGSISRGGVPWSLCCEALRTLGLFGALDPYKFELVQRGAKDCRRRAARLAIAARNSANSIQSVQEGLLAAPTQPLYNANRQSHPISIESGKSSDRSSACGRNASKGSATFQEEKNQCEPPLLAPYIAALLEDDEDEPAHAAMYAQSCAIAVPSLKDDPRPRKFVKRDNFGFLETTGMNAGEQAISGALRGDDADAFYALAHVVEEDDERLYALGERAGGMVGNRTTAQRSAGSRSARSITLKAGGEQFYAEVAIDALVRILRDNSLSSHHATVTQAMANIIQSLGNGCAPLLEDIVPHLLDVAVACEPGLRESILLQIASLAATVGSHLLEWLPRIFGLIVEYWHEHLRQIAPLLEELATAKGENLEKLTPRIFPLLLESLAPPYAERSTSEQTQTPRLSIRRNRTSFATETPRSASFEDHGVGDVSIFDDEHSLNTSAASAAPAALRELHLALILRVTMLLRDALSDHLFILAPALLRLAEALRDNGRTSDDDTSHHHRAIEDADALHALEMFGWNENALKHFSRHDGGLMDRRVSTTGLRRSKGGVEPGSNVALDELEGSPPATKLQRDLGIAALGPLWQARVLRCLCVVCSRGALVSRKELGARIARMLRTLLETSGIDRKFSEQRPAFEYFREACCDAFMSVASQLGPEIFAPFESAATIALALGPEGGTSKAFKRWEYAQNERAGMQRHGSMTLMPASSEDMLSDSTSIIDSQHEDEMSEGAGDFSVGIRMRWVASADMRYGDAEVEARFEDAAIEEISVVTRRAGQRDAPASALRRNRPAGGRSTRQSSGSFSHGGVIAGRSTSDEGRRSDRGNTSESASLGVHDANAHHGLHVNQPNLARAWDVSQRFTADDWNDWLRRLSLELLQESPSASLRSCATVAHSYPRLARQLFQPSFVSCWLELDHNYRASLVKTLETAFKSDELHAVAPDALQLLLDLAQYMERDVESLPIDIRTLAELATKCRAYAKALHYKEMEYRAPELNRNRDAAAEALIAINRKLALPEAALGVRALRRQNLAGGRRLTRHRDVLAECAAPRRVGATASETASSASPRSTSPTAAFFESENDEDGAANGAQVIVPTSVGSTGPANVAQPMEESQSAAPRANWDSTETWLGKLDSHEEALELFQRRLNTDPHDAEAFLGEMKSLDALGRWDQACSRLLSVWPDLDTSRGLSRKRGEAYGSAGDAIPTRNIHPDRLHDIPVGSRIQSFTSHSDLLDFSREPYGSEGLMPSIRNPSRREARLLVKAATVGARAAWSLGRWDDMESFVAAMENDDGSKSFYRAILALKPTDSGKTTDFDLVAELVDDARRRLHSAFAALVAESYKRAYQSLVMVQQLSEIEEIVHLRKAEHVARGESFSSKTVMPPGVPSNAQTTVIEKREELVALWRRRLAGCPPDVSTWQKILNVRSLVLDFSDDPETWLRFTSLCRHSGQTSLAEAVLTEQLGFDPESKPAPASSWTLGEHRLRYAYAKNAFAAGKSGEAIVVVEELADALGELRFDVEVDRRILPAEEQELQAGVAKLRARCLLRLGDWRLAKRGEDERRNRGSTLTAASWPSSPAGDSAYRLNAAMTRTYLANSADVEDEFMLAAPLYKMATRLDPTSYKAWHVWALANYRAVQRIWATRQSTSGRVSMRPALDEQPGNPFGSGDHSQARNVRLVAAADAFVRAIALGRRRWAASVQQDLLNLLNLWFRSGRLPEIEKLLLDPEDEDDDAAFFAAAASARSSLMLQPLGQRDAKEGHAKSIGSTTVPTSGHDTPYDGTPIDVAGSMSPQSSFSTSEPSKPQSNSRRDDSRGAPLDAWLGVLPQLIARIGKKDSSPKSTLHRLLARLGKRHPQALVYALTLQLKSPRDERCKAAKAILRALRQVAPRLVEQAQLVSGELIRVAILWHEKWHESLEIASRFYFGDDDVQAMMGILRPLHAELDAGPSTLRESAFKRAFGEDLDDARDCLFKYDSLEAEKKRLKAKLSTAIRGLDRTGLRDGSRSGSNARNRTKSLQATPLNNTTESDLHDMESAIERLQEKMDAALRNAWDKYYNVFRTVNKQLPQLTTLEMEYLSTKLVDARNLELAVPGTYRADGSAARIMQFGNSVCVITSKQRPRKLSMRGSDGRDYGFLLKGHEDLRQDERAMQLFGLVNALLSKDRRTCEHSHLLIQRYAVTPLSHDCGILNWVPGCDTLHALVREFREARKIVLNDEHRTMMKHAPDYDGLTLMQKVEVFEVVLTDKAGQDLSKVLWLKSAHCEQWLERRTHYTRSLATMSMVGHILGLGDRHPSNLMLDRRSGKVLHIDFGDSFEVAQHREKFPERVPFRLTRMLVKAMEVSGVEGTFRSTCENVMHVLRDNQDSLLSMLEAFIHDPLFSWRLFVDSRKDLGAGNSVSEQQPCEQQEGTKASTRSHHGQRQRFSSRRNGERDTDHRREESILEGEEAEESDHSAGEEDQDDDDQRGGHRSFELPSADHDEGSEDEDVDEERDGPMSPERPSEGHEEESEDEDVDEVVDEGRDDERDGPMSSVRTSADHEEESEDEDVDEERDGHRSSKGQSAARDEELEDEDDVDDEEDLTDEDDDDGRSEDAEGDSDRSDNDEDPSYADETTPRDTVETSYPSSSRTSRRRSEESNLEVRRTVHRQSKARQTYGSPQERTDIKIAQLAASNLNSATYVGSFKNSAFHQPSAKEWRQEQAYRESVLRSEVVNEKAVKVMARVEDKLSGCDFEDDGALSVVEQVDRLIQEATDVQNLCSAFIGWCPFW